MGSYKPEPADYTTFGKMLDTKSNKAEEKINNKNYFGTDMRFKDPKKSKSKLNIINPAPG